MSNSAGLWGGAAAAMLFVGLLLWQLRSGASAAGQRLLLGAYAMSACWAWLSAVAPASTVALFAETGRNLLWIALLQAISSSSGEPPARQRPVRLVYAAVAAVLFLQCVADALPLLLASPAAAAAASASGLILRITAAAGALVLVHNLYGQAAPASRSSIRAAMIGLAWLWVYDLNLYTVAYLDPARAAGLFQWRGAAAALSAPLFLLGWQKGGQSRIRLSRAATFQSLSLLAICGYFAVMAILATAVRGAEWDWARAFSILLLSAMTVSMMVLLPSARARSWAKVKLAKHLFEHRYDYRTEWLRFTATVGGSGAEQQPLGERVIKAFADILEAPGGLLLAAGEAGQVDVAADWHWPGPPPAAGEIGIEPCFWSAVEGSGRILEFDSHRRRIGAERDLAVPLPRWMLEERHAWCGIPLIHDGRLAAIVLLAGPEYRRPLDWEDFDLLRTAGRQAASSIAEAHGQQALANAQRFEEFNRRFAFILHDIKNLVSQLSLLSRNAERHADNAEFRGDMIATLKSSVGKMNDLLARLAPHGVQRGEAAVPTPLRPILAQAVAAKRRDHDVRLLGDSSLWAIADGDSLEQALGHLLQNAIDASSPAEPVTLRVSRRERQVAICISDEGCGMDADFIRTRLFQPFASTKAGGFGVGAFEARSLIHAMGGQLTVSSRPGSGSQFTILLPAAEPDHPAGGKASIQRVSA